MGNRAAAIILLTVLLAPGAVIGEPERVETAFEVQRQARVEALEAFKAAMAMSISVDQPERFGIFELSVIRTNIPLGQKIGDYSPPGLLGSCYAQDDDSISFDADRRELDHIDLYESFHDVMRRAGYQLADDPSALFPEEATDRTPTYKIGAEILAADFNICEDWDFWNPFDDDDGEWLGTLRLTVVWHIYDAKRRETVETITLEGRALLEDSSDQAQDILLRAAFRDATRHLSQSTVFQMVLQRESEPLERIMSAASGAGSWAIPTKPLHDLDIAVSGPLAIGSTVTIVTPDGHGSGFFISEDGLLLTNEHVVEAAKVARVRLINGAEVEAEVLVRHRGRDVALLRAGLARSVPLPLRLDEPDVGEVVYSIGAPLDEHLSGTMRQGIISAKRVRWDQVWLQSDVAVNGGNSGGPLVDGKGNVVGITSWARADDAGEETGVNFFVPIADALHKLGIAMVE